MRMSIEQRQLTPIEHQLLLNKWCGEKRIKRILFDLHDTLVVGRKPFQEKSRRAKEILGQNVGDGLRDKLWTDFENTNNQLFVAMGVVPERWTELMRILGEKYKLDPRILREAEEELMSIYTTPGELIPGTEEGLDNIKAAGIEMGVVTHAGRKWVGEIFYEGLNLGRWFDWDDIFIIDPKEHKHKTDVEWLAGVRYFGEKPEDCMAVGDSPAADLNPAWKIGIRQRVLVARDEIWEMHREKIIGKYWVIASVRELAYLGDSILARY